MNVKAYTIHARRRAAPFARGWLLPTGPPGSLAGNGEAISSEGV
jgi:hypothetical protein